MHKGNYYDRNDDIHSNKGKNSSNMELNDQIKIQSVHLRHIYLNAIKKKSPKVHIPLYIPLFAKK